MVYGMTCRAWHIVLPGGHGGYVVRPSGHGIWNGLVGIVWYMVWHGSHHMVYDMAWCMAYGMA